MIPASLAKKIKSDTRLVGAAVGSGMAAQAAEAGGADFLMVLSAGFFRTIGCSSMAALMPFANANELTWQTAVKTVLPRIQNCPTYIGVCAQDPGLHFESLFRRVDEAGLAGITNFPSVGFLDGNYRAALEEAGVGFDREVELLSAARKAGLGTIGFCFNEKEAIALAGKKIDFINVDLGFARWREIDREEQQRHLDKAVEEITSIESAVRKIRKNANITVYGGVVTLPQDSAFVYQRTGVCGYIGGSTIERFPAAPLITQTVKAFRRVSDRNWDHNRLGSLIGTGPVMNRLFDMIRLAAESDAPVLLLGESGTGKELAAREIHRLSSRSRKSMVGVNCGSISESLAMSELFGHERGAFTGAHSTHRGKFEQAHQTTLFMDEVGELPLEVQSSLLRVLQEREIVRVGGDRTIPVDVRLIAATNKDLKKSVKSGAFRLDLYYRLSIVVIRIPPLRERKDDIPGLTMEICHELCRRYEVPTPSIPKHVMDSFVEHDWPGNIRELRNAIERCLILGRGEPFQLEWLSDHFEMSDILRDESNQITTAHDRSELKASLPTLMKKHRGNKSAVARELGITRKTLYEWLGQLVDSSE